jgi:hypothetical protein
MEVSCQLHAPAALPPGERVPGTHWIGEWMGTRDGLGAAGNGDSTRAAQPVVRAYTN